MTDNVIIALVVGTLGVAAVVNGGLDGFAQIVGAFAVAILVRWIVKRLSVTSRFEARARRRDSAED